MNQGRSRPSEITFADDTGLTIQTGKVIWVLLLGAGVYLLLTRFGELDRIADAWRRADPLWLIAGLIGSILSYFAAALQQQGAVQFRIPFKRNLIAHVAATFADQFGPRGLGGLLVSERFLEKLGLKRRQALASVALKAAAGALVHVVALVVALYLLGRSRLLQIPLTRDVGNGYWWLVLVAGLVGLLALTIFLWRPFNPKRLLALIRASVRDLYATLQRPRRAVELFGGSFGVTFAYVLTLLACMWAVGAEVALLTVAGVYLAGELIGSASPTPGGLGILEGALVAGFAAFGVPVEQSIAGVLLYRVLTLWLPAVPGIAAFRYLQDNGYL